MMLRKRTKIVATIGPASRDPEIIRQLIANGMNVARLNFSHGSYDDHAANIATIRGIAREMSVYVAILQDLPGPKVRTGSFGESESVTLVPGARFVLTTDDVVGSVERVSVSYAGLARDVTPGTRIYLADGTLSLMIESTTDTDVITHVDVGGELRGRQGINYPDGTLQIDAVTDRDLQHLQFGLDQNVDWVAVSFVRNASDVARVKDAIAARKMTTPVIAKIEKHEALDNIEAIVALADGIMVARGDLGIEIPLEEVPLVQKDLIARANRAAKPVITATQMLESMIVSARPTRAEAADVANAILDGTDAIMLSGETARGAYPVEAVKTMATIAMQVERHYPHALIKDRRLRDTMHDAATGIAESAARITERLPIALIVTGTTTGNTARYVSSFRPKTRIVAITPLLDVARRMAVVWGVESLVVQPYRYIETLIEIAEQRVIAEGLAASGETIAITSGMPVGQGGTNVLKIHMLP